MGLCLCIVNVSAHGTRPSSMNLLISTAATWERPNAKWWPDRQGLDSQTEEFEAESVALPRIPPRIGIDNPSEKYLAGYFQSNGEVPNVSVDLVMKAAGLIEQMGREKMKPRRGDKRREALHPV